jgi:hypothetical protein
MLMFRKPLDGDVGGLLSLIMFAGLDFYDDIFFEMQVIQKAFLPKKKKKKLKREQTIYFSNLNRIYRFCYSDSPLTMNVKLSWYHFCLQF